MILTGLFVVIAWGYEEAGEKDINYLLLKDNYYVAYTTDKVLPKKFDAVIKVECERGIALRPVPKELESSMPWGQKETIYVCNTTDIKIVN